MVQSNFDLKVVVPNRGTFRVSRLVKVNEAVSFEFTEVIMGLLNVAIDEPSQLADLTLIEGMSRLDTEYHRVSGLSDVVDDLSGVFE